jgi:hypothetical protein
MKTALSLVLLILSSQAFALDELCLIKQKNAASFAIAQEIGVAVQGVEILEVKEIKD